MFKFTFTLQNERLYVILRERASSVCVSAPQIKCLRGALHIYGDVNCNGSQGFNVLKRLAIYALCYLKNSIIVRAVFKRLTGRTTSQQSIVNSNETSLPAVPWKLDESHTYLWQKANYGNTNSCGLKDKKTQAAHTKHVLKRL